MATYNTDDIVPATDIFESGRTDMGSTKDFGLVSVLVPAIISAISIAASAGTAAANRKFQKQMQQQQQAYDSPVAQLERYKEAGINPNLALGNVSSGSFGDTPSPLPDFGGVVGQAANSTFQGVNSLMDLKAKQQNLEYMQERINSLRLSNQYNSMSMGDRLRLVIANLLSANQVNDLRKYDLDFAKWYNGLNIQRLTAEDSSTMFWYPLSSSIRKFVSPRQLESEYSLRYSDIRNDKVYQDYLNAISHGDILGAQLTGYNLGNSRQQIALDYEKATNMPWGNQRPLDKLIGFMLNGLLEEYGPYIMEWIKNKLPKPPK